MEPNNPTEALEGKNITVRWDYSLTGDTVDRVQWFDMKNTEAIGKLSSKGPTRFKIDGNEKATLMIFNVTRRDTGEYKCQVDLQQSNK